MCCFLLPDFSFEKEKSGGKKFTKTNSFIHSAT
jgi:hypothetical protein